MNGKQIPIITLLTASFIGVVVATIGYWIIGFFVVMGLNALSYSKSQFHFREYSKPKRAIIGAVFGIIVFGLSWATTSNIINGQVSALAF